MVKSLDSDGKMLLSEPVKLKNDKFKRHRAKWLAIGLCPACAAHRPVIEGKTYCEICTGKRKQWSRRRYIDRRLKDQCVACGRPVEPEIEGRAYCRTCGTKLRKYMRGKALIQKGDY